MYSPHPTQVENPTVLQSLPSSFSSSRIVRFHVPNSSLQYSDASNSRLLPTYSLFNRVKLGLNLVALRWLYSGSQTMPLYSASGPRRYTWLMVIITPTKRNNLSTRDVHEEGEYMLL